MFLLLSHKKYLLLDVIEIVIKHDLYSSSLNIYKSLDDNLAHLSLNMRKNSDNKECVGIC